MIYKQQIKAYRKAVGSADFDLCKKCELMYNFLIRWCGTNKKTAIEMPVKLLAICAAIPEEEVVKSIHDLKRLRLLHSITMVNGNMGFTVNEFELDRIF